jgi:ParB-like chromosome segregation protein Spo0J
MDASQACKPGVATAQSAGESTQLLCRDEPPAHGRLVIRNLDKLHPHPTCVKHQLSASAAQLSAVAARGEEVFAEPLVITRDGIVLDGRARLALAQLQGRTTLPCIEYDLSQSEALAKLIQTHRRSTGMNDFSRILLAMDLEPDLKEKARLNQRLGGQNKGSSNLTEAAKLDVRSEIARIAGVSVGNVTKVKQLTTAHPNIIKALRENEISMHRAWLWSKLALEKQEDELWQHQSRKGVRKTIKDLISRHQVRAAPAASLCDLRALLVAIQSGKASPVRVISLRAPGKTIFVTEELLRSLEPQKELALTCVTSIS